ncbi:MAG: hypothetical protein GX335_09250, partial [Firmicutes bacterium]|nr:hypothetical protein [Bacillota bacterium]
MSKKIIALIILVFLAGGALTVWHFWRSDPAAAAEEFLRQVAAEDFSGIEKHFGE